MSNSQKPPYMGPILKSPKWVDRGYREFVSTFPCLNCGKSGPSDPHHDRRFKNCGVGMKPPDTYLIPLCHECHVKTEGCDVDPLVAAVAMLKMLTMYMARLKNGR